MAGKVHSIFFSPTHTTGRIVQEIAAQLGAGEVQQHDLTRLQQSPLIDLNDGLAVIGVPVYAGRVAAPALKRLANIKADNVPAILVVVYGNRAFEDALVELQDFSEQQGFRPIAAAAFIGEHSYSTDKQPVAAGRPDHRDLAAAADFGRQVACLLPLKTTPARLALPGERPYREYPPRGLICPDSDPQLCTLCGACGQACPTRTITITSVKVETDPANCILCCACLKVCPTSARFLEHPVVVERRKLLVDNCSARKEPVVFLCR